MSWISKSLTLDLLAIAIDGLNKAFDRINTEPDPNNDPWNSAPLPGGGEVEVTTPAPAAPAAPAPAETPPPAAPAAQAPPAAPQPEPEAEPAPDLLPEAQNILRTIAQTQGTDWITGTLFPHFNTNSLNTVPADRLPELIAMANTQAGTPA